MRAAPTTTNYQGNLPRMKPAPLSARFRLTPLAAALLAGHLVPALAADDATATAAAATTLPTVKVEEDVDAPLKPAALASPRFTQPLIDTSQTVNVVPQALIEERAATTLRDVLRNVSGISMQAGEGGTPAGDQLSMRGFSARTDIFIDNVRDLGGYTRDPFNLDQVEVVKGPSSDYSGRGSTGGSLNLVSKAPSLEPHTRAEVTGGSDAFQRYTVDSNQPLGKPGESSSALRLNAVYHKQDVAGRDVVENERYGLAPSLAFGLGTPTETTLSLFHLAQDNVPDYGLPWVPADNVPLADFANQPAPTDFENWYGLKDRDYDITRTTFATAQVKHRLTESAQLRNVTRWGQTDRDSIITAPRFASTDSTDIRRSDEKYRDQRNQIITNVTDVTLDLKTGAIEHRLLLGVELVRETEDRYTKVVTGSDSPSTPLDNPNPDDPYLEDLQRTGAISTAESTTTAFYVSDAIQLSERWKLNGGLRWDHFEFEQRPDGTPLSQRTDAMFSYRAGLTYKPVREGSVYLGYGTSFNPTAEGLIISSSSNQPGLADLEPEENRTLELGTKWELFGDKLFLNAAIFRTEKTNARTQDPDDPGDVLVLKGEQEVQGLELGAAGNLSRDWAVFAGYTLLDSEVKESRDASEVGNELPNTPEQSFSLWTTYDLLPALRFGAGLQHVDDRYSAVNNDRTAPSYTIYEAMIRYQVMPRLSLQLNGQNLGDKQYIDYVGGGHFIPGVGRTVLLSASVEL